MPSAETLNELLASRTVYTDGWGVDKPWLTTLFHSDTDADYRPNFDLRWIPAPSRTTTS
jgi:hypothetical protein